jgi:hypothetical protein
MRYIHKPIKVSAEQFKGQEIEGIKVFTPEIIYSVNKGLYYPSHCKAENWLTTAVDEDGTYGSYSFRFYSIRSHKDREQVSVDHPLVKRYLEVFNLTLEPVYAYTESDTPKKVNLGDWVVRYPLGDIVILPDHKFKQYFSYSTQG